MAYAAVVSLKLTINGLVSSSGFHPLSSTRELLQCAYKHTTSLQQVLERSNDSSRSSTTRLDALEAKIRDCAHKLEDVLEFQELSSQDEEVGQEITSFAKAVKKMEKDYIEELSRDENDDDEAVVPSNIDFGAEMVGRSSQFNIIRDYLLRPMRPDDLCFFSFFGESGCGRTIAAKIVYDDLGKGSRPIFDCCAWVTIGTEHQFKQVLTSIISQVNNPSPADHEWLISSEDDEILQYLLKILEHQRYIIVLDGVRDVQWVHYFKRSLTNQRNGSIVFFTTSLMEVAESADNFHGFEERDPQYFSDDMWFSVRAVIFGRDQISPEIEKAGKKIIENCRGCFISAAKTYLLLLKPETRLEQWSTIAAQEENPVFIVEDEISELREIKTEMHCYNWDINDRRRRLIATFISHIRSNSESVESIKKKVHPEMFFPKMQIICFSGMAGIGKSMFARNFFKDESILHHFDHHVLVTLGPKYKNEEILIDILARIYVNVDKLRMKGDAELRKDLCERLSCKRCLILLDDLWSKAPIDQLRKLLSGINVTGTILVTTRLSKVATFKGSDIHVEMELLDKEESWCLLRQKVFARDFGPYGELEKAGRKIAEKCEGLPLLILRIADELLKVETNQEYWSNVASGKEKSVFKNAHRQISKALLPSYKSLPQHLKACFLYMGIFHEKYEIPTSNLISLWTAEGFLEPNSSQNVEDYIAGCLFELDDKNLVILQRKVSDSQVKTCRLHPIFWHLSNNEATKNNLYHAMNNLDDCSIENMQSQRRLCIRNSILLGMKDVQTLIVSATSAHSLLCVIPLHQYPVPLNFEFRLLRVMDALTIRLYEFPVDIVRLVHLRYLALTCGGELPTSISSLWKLQYLIVKQYLNIKSFHDSWPLPVEIWDMKELKHLQVTGARLPSHKCGSGLLKLSTLLDTNAQSCTKEILEWIPNLKRLGIRIELAPDDDGANSFNYLNNIARLDRLESLKCVVVNPEIRSEGEPPPPPISMFPPSLKRLSLSGMGYPWEYMTIIARLENLEVLKLKQYAFQGKKWEMGYRSGLFSKLKFLSIQDTDLVQRKTNSPNAMMLERLCIKHCYELNEFPTLFATRNFKTIEVVDCNPLAATWSKRMEQTVTDFQAKVHLSWIAEARRRE